MVFLPTNFALPLSVPARHLLWPQWVVHRSTQKWDKTSAWEKKVEWRSRNSGRKERERGTFVGHHLWLNSILYLSEIKMNARQASSCMREEQSNHEGTCFFLCECITATQSSAAERGANRGQTTWGHSWANQYTLIRFDLLWYKLIWSGPAQFTSAQFKQNLPRVDCFETQQTAKSFKYFAGIIVNDALLHAVLAVRAVQKHDPNKGALSTSWEHENILKTGLNQQIK